MQANAELAGVTSNRWQSLLAKHASRSRRRPDRANYIAAQAAVDASKANVRRLEQLQSYERIVAPFDGIITARNTDIGDLIDAGSVPTIHAKLFHLDADNRLRVYVASPKSTPTRSMTAQRNSDADSNPDFKFRNHRAQRSAIDHATRTLNVEVDVNNSKGVLRPGAYVFVHFHLAAIGNAVTCLPTHCCFRAEGLPLVSYAATASNSCR